MNSPEQFEKHTPTNAYNRKLNKALDTVFEDATILPYDDSSVVKRRIWQANGSLFSATEERVSSPTFRIAKTLGFNTQGSSPGIRKNCYIARVNHEDDDTYTMRSYFLTMGKLEVVTIAMSPDQARSLFSDPEAQETHVTHFIEAIRTGVCTPSELERMEFLADAESFKDGTIIE